MFHVNWFREMWGHMQHEIKIIIRHTTEKPTSTINVAYKGHNIKTLLEYFVYQELFPIRPFVFHSESVNHFGTIVVTVV